MKTRFLLVIVAVFASVTLHAQFVAQMVMRAPHYYPGEVYFVDGHSEEYAEIELPQVGKGKLGIKKNAGDKGHTELDADNIVGVKIWHKDFPDKKHVLYHVHAQKVGLQSEHQWGNPDMGSDWGVIFRCEMNYQIEKKTGDLKYVKFVGGTGPQTPSLFYLVRPDKELADLVLVNGIITIDLRKKVSLLFEEKPEIAAAIKKGKLYTYNDMQYILDEMASGQKTETALKLIPEEQTVTGEEANTNDRISHKTITDSISNGVVGDDE